MGTSSHSPPTFLNLHPATTLHNPHLVCYDCYAPTPRFFFSFSSIFPGLPDPKALVWSVREFGGSERGRPYPHCQCGEQGAPLGWGEGRAGGGSHTPPPPHGPPTPS